MPISPTQSATTTISTSRRWVTVTVTGIVGLDIAMLTWLRITSTAGPLELAGQILLVVAFAALAVVDLRAATAIAVLELVVGGAAGRWTDFGYGLYGRPVLDGILFAVAVIRLLRNMGLKGLAFGRYTLHGMIVSVVLAIWIPFGIANGNSVQNALADGNGFHFFAFSVVVTALALQGDLGWLRRWLFVACATNALVTVLLAVAVLSGAIPVASLEHVLISRVDMGGTVSYDPSGALRLYLGSGLFLQVGLVLVVWELLRKPRRVWPWLLLGLFALALLATYTRGYWLGAAVGAAIVIGLGLSRPRQTIAAMGVAVVLFLVGTLAASNFGISLPNYLWDRVGSIGLFEFSDGAQNSGVGSNVVKLVQAKVLLAHIAERPVVGWGFGTIAPDYPYAQSYSYELSYLDLAYKTGIVGLLLFVSFPLRLLFDAIRGRLGRISLPPGIGRREAAVPIGVLCSVLVVWATNPYLGAAFGQASVVLSIAWLDPFRKRSREQLSESEPH
jgi:hypothetical protein